MVYPATIDFFINVTYETSAAYKNACNALTYFFLMYAYNEF
jgi:hypothetical protein